MPDNTLGNKGALIHPCGCRALISALRAPLCGGCAPKHACGRSAEGLWAHGSFHAPTLAACAAQGKLHFPCDSLCCLPFCVPTKQNTLLRQAVPFHEAESRRSEVNRYRNLSLQHQDHQPGERQVSRCRCCLPKRRENHKRMGRHDP